MDNCTYVCDSGRPTSPQSIFNLREELKKYPKTKHRDRVLNELRSVAKYQFGAEAEAMITDDVVAKGRYHRTLYSNGKTVALLNRDVGLYTLNLEGGRRLAELGIHVGKAVLTGREMTELRNGIGVKIRHRKKN